MVTPRVSIIIPVYNGSNYLAQAIESALAQTWPEVEIIVVNDGSCDGGATEAIALSFGDSIRYIAQPNGGVGAALNAGIREMSGDIFCWLSHDDLHHREKTARQVEEWNALGRADVVLFSDYRLIDHAGREIATVRMDHSMLQAKPYYALLRGSIHGCSVFLPKTIFAKVGCFNETLPTTQDYDLWRRVIASYRFVHIAEALISSRWHAEQASKTTQHASEASAFWLDAVDKTPVEVQESLEGTRYRFFCEMGEFLRKNNLGLAATGIAHRAKSALSEILVSVVIPVFNNANFAVSALDSVLAQTHENIEVVLVDDGSNEDMAILEQAAAAAGARVRVLRQDNRGPASARNVGWAAARGRYVAFLDADDLFLPTKVEIQLEHMARSACRFSHTSYFRCWDNDVESLTRVNSAAVNAFPEMIAGCSIATPTTMVATSLFGEGLRFPEDIRCGEDVVLWLNIAQRYGVTGIRDALTIVRASGKSAAYDSRKQLEGLENILTHVRRNPSLHVHRREVARLTKLAAQQQRKAGV
jgi:glycosyltransferase involved in cell wall biosynthesis